MTSENGDPSLSQKAEEFKLKANEFFKNGDYNHAILEYEKAIDIMPSAVYYSNRSFAYLKTECFGYALMDADQAISLDPNYVKGYYRRASANMALGKFKLAQQDFETVVRIYKNDKDAKMKLEECRKIVRRKAFEKAIAVEEKKSCLDSTDISDIIIESSYSGPHLEEKEITSDKCKSYENYVVTESFMLHLIQHFKQQKKLHRKYALIILKQIKDYLCKLESLVEIDVPDNSKFTICGDIHGQYFDLCNIFDMNGLPSKENPYLFNGDFVDRGSFSVECIFTLLGFKLLYPNHFYMARGNHESENMNQMYGFEGEVKAKYSANMVEMFTEVFNWLPLAHLINKRILTMHGGLFRDEDVMLDDIKRIDRNRQPPDSGLMCDLLWSDPQMLHGRAPSKRGVGCQFGPDVTEKFCKDNNLDYIIRSHEVKDEGYELTHRDRCVTVFSAPNYCDTMHNRGAYINIKGSHSAMMTPKFFSFKEVPHPNVRPMAYANSLLSMLA